MPPTVRFLIDGAAPPEDSETYDRVVLPFDGEDEEAVTRGTALRGRPPRRADLPSPIGKRMRTGAGSVERDRLHSGASRPNSQRAQKMISRCHN